MIILNLFVDRNNQITMRLLRTSNIFNHGLMFCTSVEYNYDNKKKTRAAMVFV